LGQVTLLKKWYIIFPYLLIISIAFIYKEALLQWINKGDATQIPYMILLSVFIGIFPVVPFTLFAGVMGAKFGPLIGGLINWCGAVLASIGFFLLTRYAFAEFFRNFISRYDGLSNYSRMIDKNSFLAVFFARIIHIVPTPVINIYSGISLMSFSTYLLATVLGQMPGMFLYAFIGDQIFASPKKIIMGVSSYLAFSLITFLIYRFWYKGKQKVVNN
jgi:uncharacterized membrane protein YdjX (TVP38/TMEM64 family)